MRILISACLFTLLLWSIDSRAQREQVWAFGNRGGLDFNSGAPVEINTAMDTKEACASICDTNGQLLFYSEGSLVWNRNHQLMPGGAGLTPMPNTFMTPTVSTSQGVVIVPVMDVPGQYYIFSLVASEWPNDFGKLYYSIVDMSLDGGLGDVITTKKAIFLDDGNLEKMVPVVGNHCNIWLLTCSKSAEFRAYEITATGINPAPVTSKVGLGSVGKPYGCMAVSPDRKRVAAAQMGSTNGAAIYDFDPNTGIVSNELQLLPYGGAYDACFSPDNSKLYVVGSGGNSNHTLQFDLSSGNKDTILKSGTYVGGITFTDFKSGPDDKIYFKSGSKSIGVIKYPNLAGTACEFTPISLIFNANPDLVSRTGFPNDVPVLNREYTYTRKEYVFTFAESFNLKASQLSGYDYLWNDGTAGTEQEVTESGIYWVDYRMPPCALFADTFKVTFLCRLPKISKRNSCREEADGKAWLTPADHDTVSYQYVWRNEGNEILSVTDSLQGVVAGNYTVQILSSVGCDTVLPVYIPSDNFEVSFTVDTLACVGLPVSFRNTSAAYFEDFNWFFGDRESSALPHPDHHYREQGLYEAMLTGRGKVCADTAYRYITVDAPMPVFSFSKQKDSICAGTSIRFYPQQDPTILAMHWSFGHDHALVGREESLLWTFDEAGSYPVALTASFRACPDLVARDTVWVLPLPYVNLGADTAICPGATPVTLSNQAPAGTEQHYVWNTGATTAAIQVTHPGSYQVQATNRYGCRTSESVTVHKNCYGDIPNAFTPNGDGVNDYFFPRQLLSRGINAFRLQVLNRWGQVLFETTNQDGSGWDGQFNNRKQPEGVYVYRIEALFEEGSREVYQGDLTLIR